MKPRHGVKFLSFVFSCSEVFLSSLQHFNAREGSLSEHRFEFMFKLCFPLSLRGILRTPCVSSVCAGHASEPQTRVPTGQVAAAISVRGAGSVQAAGSSGVSQHVCITESSRDQTLSGRYRQGASCLLEHPFFYCVPSLGPGVLKSTFSA